MNAMNKHCFTVQGVREVGDQIVTQPPTAHQPQLQCTNISTGRWESCHTKYKRTSDLTSQQ
jgi:hypothetical protein